MDNPRPKSPYRVYERTRHPETKEWLWRVEDAAGNLWTFLSGDYSYEDEYREDQMPLLDDGYFSGHLVDVWRGWDAWRYAAGPGPDFHCDGWDPEANRLHLFTDEDEKREAWEHVLRLEDEKRSRGWLDPEDEKRLEMNWRWAEPPVLEEDR